MTNYRLKKLRNLNIEELNVRKYVLNNLHKEKKKSNVIPMTLTAIVSIAFIAFMINVFEQSPKLLESSNHGTPAIEGGNPEEVIKKIEELSTEWATALKTRDGKPRYEMMSEKAKEKFIQEQIITSGENWNYVIGDSSPWVVRFETHVEGTTATITYDMQTSEASNYSKTETIHFIEDEHGKIVVDDYQSTEINGNHSKEHAMINNNSSAFVELKNDFEKDIFQRAVNNSEKVTGIDVDMANPQYQYNMDQDSYYLWITADSGTIMNTKETTTIYILSSESVKEIYEFFYK